MKNLRWDYGWMLEKKFVGFRFTKTGGDEARLFGWKSACEKKSKNRTEGKTLRRQARSRDCVSSTLYRQQAELAPEQATNASAIAPPFCIHRPSVHRSFFRTFCSFLGVFYEFLWKNVQSCDLNEQIC